MSDKKNTTRTCGKCKTMFPVGRGHDARTCGKIKATLSKLETYTTPVRDLKTSTKVSNQLKKRG